MVQLLKNLIYSIKVNKFFCRPLVRGQKLVPSPYNTFFQLKNCFREKEILFDSKNKIFKNQRYFFNQIVSEL